MCVFCPPPPQQLYFSTENDQRKTKVWGKGTIKNVQISLATFPLLWVYLTKEVYTERIRDKNQENIFLKFMVV